ncbi:MAG: transposase, partial [Chloroflexales bacterium]|nr:transposase [Chloroflexales bacterium]
PDERPAIGIDVGLKSFLTDRDGNTVANPRSYRARQTKRRRKQRRWRARTKGSKRQRTMADRSRRPT